MSQSSAAKPTKNQRRDEARAKALALRQEQERTARRQRIIAISLLVVGLVVLGAVVAWILSNRPEPAPDLSQVENPLAEVATPSTANDVGGIVVGQNGVAGDTASGDDAVVVTVYLDFMCPVCGYFEQLNGPLLTQQREAGDVLVEYRPVSILDRTSQGSQFSTRAATAAALVADQAPEDFVAFNDLMFANQPEEGTSGLDDQQIADLAVQAGVAQDVADRIADGSYLKGEGSFKPWVAAATEQATRDFAPQFGTPTVLVDGENLADLGVDWRIEGALAAAIAQARG